MSTKIQKDNLRKQFRSKLFAENIHQVENYDAAFEYKYVIFTYKHDPGRVDRYIDAGWEIVESTESTIDDRDFTPNSKNKETLRPQPIVVTTRDGHQQVLLRCLKTRRSANEKAKREARERIAAQQAHLRGAKTERRGNEVITRESELNEKNV